MLNLISNYKQPLIASENRYMEINTASDLEIELIVNQSYFNDFFTQQDLNTLENTLKVFKNKNNFTFIDLEEENYFFYLYSIILSDNMTNINILITFSDLLAINNTNELQVPSLDQIAKIFCIFLKNAEKYPNEVIIKTIQNYTSIISNTIAGNVMLENIYLFQLVEKYAKYLSMHFLCSVTYEHVLNLSKCVSGGLSVHFFIQLFDQFFNNQKIDIIIYVYALNSNIRHVLPLPKKYLIKIHENIEYLLYNQELKILKYLIKFCSRQQINNVSKIFLNYIFVNELFDDKRIMKKAINTISKMDESIYFIDIAANVILKSKIVAFFLEKLASLINTRSNCSDSDFSVEISCFVEKYEEIYCISDLCDDCISQIYSDYLFSSN